MAKPLRTDDSNPPQSMQFTHFGVLNDGQQSKSSVVTSITLNIIIALCVLIIGAAAKKTIDHRQKLTSLTEPIPVKQPEPVKPPPPVAKLPPPPKIKVEPPKIQVAEVKLPDLPKPPEVKMTQPTPVIAPAPPKAVQAPPAPKVVNLGRAEAASVMANNHPAPVSLGQQNNPIAPSDRPATSAVNLGQRGMAGMPSSNTGMGATKVSLGNGSAGGTNMAGTGTRPIQGVKLGVTGGTGPMNSTSRLAGPVNLGQNQPPPIQRVAAATPTAQRSGPKVLFKPRPQYTDEAVKLHIEGTVSVRLRVSSAGSVQVLGVTNGLGHGLDEAAIRAVQATRFQPAMDATGSPMDWEGVVNVAFQLAG